MPRVSIGEVNLYYEEQGEGEPLVLIPGFAAGIWIWFRQISPLANHFRVISFDPRGVAQSDPLAGKPGIRSLADDVAGLLKAIGVSSAHILGASFGGFVAQEFALAYPEATRSLILCCTSFGGRGHVSPSADTLRALASTRELDSEDRVRRSLILAFSPHFVSRRFDELQKVIELRAANAVPEEAYLAQLQAALQFDAESRVSKIQSPTLVVSGDADVIVPVENSRNLATKLNASLKIVAGGSHTFFIEQPDEFNNIVTDFIHSQSPQLKD